MWSLRPGRSRTHEPSLSHSRLRFGCFCGTLRPSRRHSRSTRLWLTSKPSARSSAVAWSGAGPGPCTPGAARRDPARAPLGRARPPRAASPGSVFSRGGLLEDRLVQLGVGQEPLQPRVLLLELLEPLRLVDFHAAVL